MRHAIIRLTTCLLIAGLALADVQEVEAAPAEQAKAEAEGDSAAAEVPAGPGPMLEQQFKWEKGPAVGKLGDLAQVSLPDQFLFTGKEDTIKILELFQNPTNGGELGMVMPAGRNNPWLAVFEFSDVGYVSDEEKNEIDADALLKSLKEGTEEGNKERTKRGWPALELVGWAQPPHYDEQTHNLVWAINLKSEGDPFLNHNTRLLGRNGVMSVTLMVEADELQSALPEFNKVLAGFGYSEGQRYGDYRKGDKIAEYGLMGLVAGGAVAVAAKSGLLGKLWKLIVVGVVAVGAFFKKLFFGEKIRKNA